MASPTNSSSSHILSTRKFHTPIMIIRFVFALSLMTFLPLAKSLSFSFSSFRNDDQNMVFMNDSSVDPDGVLQMTRNQQDAASTSKVGRASYSKPVRLWNKATGELTNFSTRFQFLMKRVDGNARRSGDGITFFLTGPFNSSSSPPEKSAGGCLGLINGTQGCNVTSKDIPFVAVEFDTYKNFFDNNTISDSHLGIDVNSVVSVADASCSGLENGSKADAYITYDSSSMNLSVYLTYTNHSPIFLSHIIDLRTVLPQVVRVGFTASTGLNAEIHEIFSWEFNSTLPDVRPLPTPTPTQRPLIGEGKRKKSRGKLGVIVVASSIGVLIVIGLALIGFRWHKRKSDTENDTDEFEGYDDFESGTGPRRYKYHELSNATNNFDEDRKLGEGGFGCVYLGLLVDSCTEIAVKKVSRGSKQGKKEFASEVKIISRLRHRNLVQLLGWCHERGDLLLVYEFMPNGSLDSHLYKGQKDRLSWEVRYKIALGLASALFYLHEEWEQCVVHRDIKSSNIMLDFNFNAKLGDFGLARLVDHELGSQTTVLAGTIGYLDPECATTGKASKESDVYSFGVVALEIVCGRRPIEIKEEPKNIRMVEWVWDLYGQGCVLEAIDKRLVGEYDVHQAESLMMVGLWCCYPDPTLRPSISQVIGVLKTEASLPILPSKFPVPVYSPPISMGTPSFPSTSGLTSSSGTTSSSAQSMVSGSAPLLSST